MKIVVNFIDNEIAVENNNVFNIEVENKVYFYRLINEFNLISKGVISENIFFLDEDSNELNLLNKIDLYIDYFNIEFNSKKIINNLYKLLKSNIDEENKIKINKCYLKIKSILAKSFLDYNLPLVINDDFDIDTILKLLKVTIDSKNNLLNNLFLLIDINNNFRINELLIFVNLKQYLTLEELNEFYKYSIYSDIKILLIDSQCYGVTNKFEKKLIIDGNLDEFLL